MFLRILIIILILPIFLLAEETESQVASPPPIVESLSQIAKSLENLSNERQLEKNPEQLKIIKSEQADLEYDFIEVATGLNLAESNTLENKDSFSWSNELYVLLSPLINELKAISSRPREIEAIKEELAKHEKDFTNSNQLITGFKKIEKQTSDPLLEKYLTSFQEKWIERRNKTETEITILSQRLAARLAEKKSITESLSDIFDLFFKNRGKNFIIAIFICLSFLLILKFINHFIYQRLLHSHRKKKEAYLKLLKVCYAILTILGTTIVFIGALFYLEDWLLLVVTGLILLTIFWSTKQIIPRFWMQAVLIMNSGPVRENERVSYQGIPYKIRKINFHSFLVNPDLEGGIIRLPINDLEDLRSRPITATEPWFPTQKGDWILFGDNKFHSQVIFQSPDNVILQSLGGSKMQVKSADFCISRLINLSSGFRINLNFGLDYKHQAEIIETIPQIFKTSLEAKLAFLHLDFTINKLSIELARAGSSSLDLAIILDCDGKVAKEYQKLERILSRLCVEVCNENEFVIAFDQMRIHLAEPERSPNI